MGADIKPPHVGGVRMLVSGVEFYCMEAPGRRNVTIPAADGEKFKEWVNAPAKIVPALRGLAATRLSWED